jgi:uncharacterized protein YegP (UPF0339 family)
MNHPVVQIYRHFRAAENSGEDEWGWRLKAANGEEVASGEGYTSPSGAERGFKDAQSNMLQSAAIQIAQGDGYIIDVLSEDDDPEVKEPNPALAHRRERVGEDY